MSEELTSVEKMADRIVELETILDECFESVIAPLGADIVIKPNPENEDLAQRVFKILQKEDKRK